MFGTQQCSVEAYMKAGIETGVDSARARQLTGMPFGGAARTGAPHSRPLEAPQP